MLRMKCYFEGYYCPLPSCVQSTGVRPATLFYGCTSFTLKSSICVFGLES